MVYPPEAGPLCTCPLREPPLGKNSPRSIVSTVSRSPTSAFASLAISELAANTDPSAGDELNDFGCKDATGNSMRARREKWKGLIVSTSSNTDGISDKRSTTPESLKFLLSHRMLVAFGTAAVAVRERSRRLH